MAEDHEKEGGQMFCLKRKRERQMGETWRNRATKVVD
jgi:hypothetical protein